VFVCVHVARDWADSQFHRYDILRSIVADAFGY